MRIDQNKLIDILKMPYGEILDSYERVTRSAQSFEEAFDLWDKFKRDRIVEINKKEVYESRNN